MKKTPDIASYYRGISETGNKRMASIKIQKEKVVEAIMDNNQGTSTSTGGQGLPRIPEPENTRIRRSDANFEERFWREAGISNPDAYLAADEGPPSRQKKSTKEFINDVDRFHELLSEITTSNHGRYFGGGVRIGRIGGGGGGKGRSAANKPLSWTETAFKNFTNNLEELEADRKMKAQKPEEYERSLAQDKRIQFLRELKAKAMGTTVDDESIKLVEQYAIDMSDDKIIKYYDTELKGYVIVSEDRTEKDRFEISKVNLKIISFAYYYDENDCRDVAEILVAEKLNKFMDTLDLTALRRGSYSIIMDLYTYTEESYPPDIKLRAALGYQTLMLRPVVIDGVAIQFASYDQTIKPFFECSSTKDGPYEPLYNLKVKMMFDVALNFLIRGHKAIIYLPMYYKKYVLPGGMAKVDDVYAFREMLDCGLIEFLEVEKRHGHMWFNVVKEMVEKKNAVFVSSTSYDKKQLTQPKYEKSSERVLTPMFLTTGNDSLMVLEASIRYRTADKKFAQVPMEKILYYDINELSYEKKMEEQLYLESQIEMICKLCQLYPLKSLHNICVKSLLYLIVRSDSNVDLPFMGRELVTS